MKKVLASLSLLIILSSISFSDPNNPHLSTFWDSSYLTAYDVIGFHYLTVDITSSWAGDPTDDALKELEKKIIDFCKENNFDGFVDIKITYAKPFDVGKLIATGTLLKLKQKNN